MQRQHLLRIQSLRVLRRVRHEQRLPLAVRRHLPDFERGAEALFQILFHVHPQGHFARRRLAPTAEDRSDEHTRQPHAARHHERGKGNRRELENNERDEPHNAGDEKAPARAAQRVIETTALSGPLQCGFDGV